MIAIWKREFRGYFRSYLGWTVAAILLLACGFCSFGATIHSLSADFAGVFTNLPLILILIVPAVAVYTFTREHARENWLWLGSLPVGRVGQTVGKYLAALSLLWLPSAVLLPMPPLLANLGKVSSGSAYVAILGYFLMIAAILALCSFIASRIKNTVLSVIVCVLLCAVLFFLTSIAVVAQYFPWVALLILILLCAAVGALVGILKKSLLRGILTAGIPAAVLALLYLVPNFYTHTLSRLIYFLSPFDRPSGFMAGHFDLPAAIYLLSFAILFVTLAACPLSLRMIRSGRAVTAGILLPAIVLCNVFSLLLPFRAAYPDVSGSDTYTLSDASRRYLSTVSEDVEIIYYSAGGERHADKDFYPFLLQYSDMNPRVRVRVVDTEVVDGLTSETVEIRSAKRSRTVAVADLYYYYNSAIGTMHTLPEYAQILQTIATISDLTTYAQMMQIYSPAYVSAHFAGDANLTGAIRYVLAEETPLVLFYSKGMGSGMSSFFPQQLTQACLDVRAIFSLSELTQEAPAVCLSLTEDLTPAEATALSDYLNEGGALLLTTTYTASSFPNLNALLSEYGLLTPEKKTMLYDSATASPTFEAVEGAQHPVTDLFDGSFVASYAHPIRITETEGVSHTVLFQTSTSGYAIIEGADTPDKGAFPFGVLAKKGEGRVLWLSMLLDSYVFSLSGGENADFVECAMQWMTDSQNASADVPSRALPSSYVTPTDTSIVLWVVFFILLLPVASVTVGIVRVYIRKKR